MSELDEALVGIETNDCDLKRSIECRYCGEDGLHWVEVKSNVWRLFNVDDDEHRCISSKADVFHNRNFVRKTVEDSIDYYELDSNALRGYKTNLINSLTHFITSSWTLHFKKKFIKELLHVLTYTIIAEVVLEKESK